jgi:hypothetical protein
MVMDNTTRTAAEFEAALAGYIAALNAASVRHHAANFPTLAPDVFSVDRGGRKYLRVVCESRCGASRSSHAFVERATGLIWKSASWKAPALNFPRGSIYQLDALKVTNTAP